MGLFWRSLEYTCDAEIFREVEGLGVDKLIESIVSPFRQRPHLGRPCQLRNPGHLVEFWLDK